MTDEFYAIASPPATAGTGGAMITTVRLSGEFDLGASEDFRAAVNRVVAEGLATSIVFDLADVTFIDAVTIGILFSGYITTHHQDRDYRVVNAHGLVQRVLDVLDPANLLQPGRPSRIFP